MYFFQPGFDPEFRKLHVGKVLLARVVERCYEEQLTEFDFLRGTEEYKFDWTSQKRPTRACNVALTASAKTAHWASDAARRFEIRRMALRQRLVARLKSTPAGARAVATLKRLLGRPGAAPASSED
jgi:CelD/BcsL family acetyltransferase involved in cellulose biosynthesis